MALDFLYLSLLFGEKRARRGEKESLFTVIDWVLEDENHYAGQNK